MLLHPPDARTDARCTAGNVQLQEELPLLYKALLQQHCRGKVHEPTDRGAQHITHLKLMHCGWRLWGQFVAAAESQPSAKTVRTKAKRKWQAEGWTAGHKGCTCNTPSVQRPAIAGTVHWHSFVFLVYYFSFALLHFTFMLRPRLFIRSFNSMSRVHAA